jgi:hypothetical protein
MFIVKIQEEGEPQQNDCGGKLSMGSKKSLVKSRLAKPFYT